jgi:hypothetical protein
MSSGLVRHCSGKRAVAVVATCQNGLGGAEAGGSSATGKALP